ncbi:hypothetical protein Tco_0041856, partial [Tanacetum coccineum]
MIEKLFHETSDEVTLAKASSQPQSTYEAASTLTEFELKKILLDKMKKKTLIDKKDPLHTQVTTLVDEHLDTRLGETKDEFMKFLSESLTTRIKEQVKDQ